MPTLKTITQAAVFGGGLILATTAIAAEATYRKQVMDQLRGIAAAAETVDYEAVGHRIEIMKRNGRMTLQVRLRKGAEYVIAGVCDSDCHGMSVALYDENGNLIDDADGGDHLTVKVTPKWTGAFRVVVGMTNCRENECHAGVAAFKR